MMLKDVVSAIRWNSQGLIPAVVQDVESKQVLMLAWMNKESLALTIQEQRGVYWSRSRQEIWRKGEVSGNVQQLRRLRLDCDMDSVLLIVEQRGAACHTGRKHCFFYELGETVVIDPLVE